MLFRHINYMMHDFVGTSSALLLITHSIYSDRIASYAILEEVQF